MPGRGVGTVGAIAVAVMAASVMAAASTSGVVALAQPSVVGGPAIVLPAPTGPHQVGSAVLHLVDRDRSDPFVPDRRRELMVTVTYPAGDVTGHPLAPYLSSEAAAAFAPASGLPVATRDLLGVRSNAHRGAPVVSAPPHSLPVLLYSPGMTVPRVLGTGTAEELASRGYVVVSIDHTHEAQVVEFPGGRLVAAAPSPEDPERDTPWLRLLLGARVADTEFVLDELGRLAAGENPDEESDALPAGLGAALDVSRVGMYGHSLGGFTAAEAMARDARIDAGVNLDGRLGFADGVGDSAAAGLDQPFLLMSSERVAGTGGLQPSWDVFRAHTRGWTSHVELAGGGHYSFTDLATLVPPAVRAAAPELLAPYLGTIAPDRARTCVDGAVAAVFDGFVRGVPGPLPVDGAC